MDELRRAARRRFHYRFQPRGRATLHPATLCAANVTGRAIDYINGHLTATMADSKEITNLMSALESKPETFPYINSTKSMIGHALGASGAIESVASVLQLRGGFVHPFINCEDLHEDLRDLWKRIPAACTPAKLSTVLKVSFGFGDVNACIVFSKWGQS